MKLHLDVKDNIVEQHYAVEIKVGDHPNHRTFSFKHEAIQFTTIEAAFDISTKLENLAWDDSKAILLKTADLPFFIRILLEEYGMDYLYYTDFQVKKINISYSLLTDTDKRKLTIGQILAELNEQPS